MAEYPYHESVRLQNFTVFEDATLNFVPGVNVFVGENGTGKTHVLKALYAAHRAQSRQESFNFDILCDLFQIKETLDLVRMSSEPYRITEVSGIYDELDWNYEWGYNLEEPDFETTSISKGQSVTAARPVFIPALDMMGHSRGFTEAYDEVRLDFDLTCRDIVNLLRLERRNGSEGSQENSAKSAAVQTLADLMGGGIERDDAGRFYLVTALGRQPMPLVAEGLRKIVTLVTLEKNGWLVPGATLFWDEPEVNLNPVLMDEVVGAILALARSGVQVFLATHSYVILKELDLQADKGDAVRYFGFERGENGTTVNPADDLASLHPNPILEQYNSLYDRELTRATGRNRRGERVR